MTRFIKTGVSESGPNVLSEMADVAPSPPIGPTTATGLAAMLVGVVVAVLSLFDVVPTDEDVQALGVVVGAVLFAVPYVTMAISRTKQARTLAEVASVERRQAASLKSAEKSSAPVVVAPEGAGDAEMRALAGVTGGLVVPAGSNVTSTSGNVVWFDAEPVAPTWGGDTGTIVVDSDDEPDFSRKVPGPLGAPVDKSAEVPGGGIRPPGVDVGGQAGGSVAAGESA